jgi:hypothetical protein
LCEPLLVWDLKSSFNMHSNVSQQNRKIVKTQNMLNYQHKRLLKDKIINIQYSILHCVSAVSTVIAPQTTVKVVVVVQPILPSLQRILLFCLKVQGVLSDGLRLKLSLRLRSFLSVRLLQRLPFPLKLPFLLKPSFCL